ncbi:hypothetical protein [Aeromicrobium sp. UC242_57]|uniref:hypothetical protein n=1 Tax=Aeromicrobium sp. UC242_57 TaxID=3374624 RepID=UPI0037A80586
MTHPETSLPADEITTFDPVLDRLTAAVDRLHRNALLTFLAAGLALLISLWTLYQVSSHATEIVIEHDKSITVFLFELLRTTAFAGVVTAGVWGLFNLGRAQLDQATRYEKRLIAAHFLNYTLATYGQEIRDEKMQLSDVMSFLKSWSENVESAFTNLKFGSRKTQDFSISVGPGGTSVTTGAAKAHVPAPPAGGDN